MMVIMVDRRNRQEVELNISKGIEYEVLTLSRETIFRYLKRHEKM